jgi:hypothetical protein
MFLFVVDVSLKLARSVFRVQILIVLLRGSADRNSRILNPVSDFLFDIGFYLVTTYCNIRPSTLFLERFCR